MADLIPLNIALGMAIIDNAGVSKWLKVDEPVLLGDIDSGGRNLFASLESQSGVIRFYIAMEDSVASFYT